MGVYGGGLGYFSVIWKFEPSLLYSVHCLGLQVKIVFSCSYNSDKLASTCHILFPSFGTQNEILRAQGFWAESRSWIWDFKWNLNWTFKFEPRVQFCRLLPSMFFVLVLFFSHVLIGLLLTLNVSDICIQMTKLAIIPCTVLLETLFLGKKFRFYLTSFPYYDFYVCLSLYT